MAPSSASRSSARSRRPPWWLRLRHRDRLACNAALPFTHLGPPSADQAVAVAVFRTYGMTVGPWAGGRLGGRPDARALQPIGSAARQHRTPAGGVGASATGPKHSSTPDHMPPSYCIHIGSAASGMYSREVVGWSERHACARSAGPRARRHGTGAVPHRPTWRCAYGPGAATGPRGARRRFSVLLPPSHPYAKQSRYWPP